MQSAPPECFPTATSVDISNDTICFRQHGIQPHDHQTLGSPTANRDVSETATSADDTDAISISSSVTSRGRKVNTNDRRMNKNDGSSQEGSPGSRIDAYEQAHALPRKPSDGMVFQVVPSNSNAQPRVSVLDFPNEVLTHILSHLPPESLSLMSLVNSRFHQLVTTPPAWRIAFARFFPGAESTGLVTVNIETEGDIQRSQRRAFTRVSTLASWRSEYILRTRLLRSLTRGKPAIQAAPASGGSKHKGSATSVITYGSGLMYPVSHINANFGIGFNKKQPLFVHGAVEQGTVSTSDPSLGKAGSWGLADFEAFRHFADVHAGEAEYGLGTGEVVGMPNVMDVSAQFGKLYGEALPGGRLFYTSMAEQRGRFLMVASMANYEMGIPEVNMSACAITSVWLAKSENVLRVTNGVVGALAGAANGVLSAYAVGTSPVYEKRYDRGELTARWAICPGIPIVSIVVDEKASARRIGRQRIWLTVLNALGEVYYLTDVPQRADVRGKLSESELDRLAWRCGRTVDWKMIELTRRRAKVDPFDLDSANGSYTPHSSSDALGLGVEQLKAEALELEKFLRYSPQHFQNLCHGWDMRSKLLVDYAGDEQHGGGEAIFVIQCGHEEGETSNIRRYVKHRDKVVTNFDLEPYPAIVAPVSRTSIFSNISEPSSAISSPAGYSVPRSRTSSNEDLVEALYTTTFRATEFSFGTLRDVEISALATDNSDIALLAANEDPLLGMTSGSDTSSPIASPLGQGSHATSPSEIPGHRARLFGVGTTTGIVVLWDMRASNSPAPDIVNTVQPIRYIHTKSPQISSLAMTSLYVVHGGNDGLVQAWDPLASTVEPVRTLNSRFSDRARRRIAQAEASIHGVGNNYYAAGAVVLDPDPTILRGMVSLGTHLRYWSYSAGAADAYKSRKRGQLRRRSDRGSNAATNDQKYHHTGRGVLRDYITDERLNLEHEKVVKQREDDRLTHRFGTNLLGEGASEEEMLAYAALLSEESYASDEVKRQASSPVPESARSARQGPEKSADTDLEEAIRQSLLETEFAMESPQTPDFDIPIRYAKSSKHGTPTKNKAAIPNAGGPARSSSQQQQDDDLKFTLQLSMAEEESRRAMDTDFPALQAYSSHGSGSGDSVKGKGKSRRKR